MSKWQQIYRTTRVLTLTAVATLLVGACAPAATVKPPQLSSEIGEIIPISEDKGWRQVIVSFQWPDRSLPNWHLDALLADQVFRPIILEHGDRIGLWRFHRRAARDGFGHRFRFLFYADGATGALVNAEVERDATVQWLIKQKSITALKLAAIGPVSPDFASSSDPNWPDSIQRSWPFYIYGVSQTWLDLIRQVSVEQSPTEGLAGDQLVDRFRLINERVSELWRANGQHAYLHHLNAIFAYQPLEIRETKLKRF